MIPHPDAYFYETQQRQVEQNADSWHRQKPISRISVFEKFLLASGAVLISVGTRFQQRSRQERTGQPNIINP